MPAVREYSISLSRTGGQGSKGDSVTDASIVNGNIVFTITRGDGTTYEINAGALAGQVDTSAISDIQTVNLQDGDILQYNIATATYNNHQLTTSKILDIDNTGQQEGSFLVYDNTTSKYKSTTRLESSGTTLIGGSF